MYLTQTDENSSPSPHATPSLLLPLTYTNSTYFLPAPLSTKPKFRTGRTAVLIHEASYKVNQATSLRTMKP